MLVLRAMGASRKRRATSFRALKRCRQELHHFLLSGCFAITSCQSSSVALDTLHPPPGFSAPHHRHVASSFAALPRAVCCLSAHGCLNGDTPPFERLRMKGGDLSGSNASRTSGRLLAVLGLVSEVALAAESSDANSTEKGVQWCPVKRTSAGIKLAPNTPATSFAKSAMPSSSAVAQGFSFCAELEMCEEEDADDTAVTAAPHISFRKRPAVSIQ
eukprot:3937144-Rhodomonas_salina.4